MVFISGCYLSASASLLTIHAGNNFYISEDRIDTTGRNNNLYFDLGFGIDDIGGSGLSFQTDLKASNAFLDGVSGASARKTYELTTGYLEWQSGNNAFGVRLGRQRYSNLSFDSYEIDGLSFAVQPTGESSINLALGMLVPSSWGNPFDATEFSLVVDPSTGTPLYIDSSRVTRYTHTYISKPAEAGVAMIDGVLSMIPHTNLFYSLALVPGTVLHPTVSLDSIPHIDGTGVLHTDSLALVEHSGKTGGDFRVALGADITPVSFLRLTGSGRFSAYHKGIDRFDTRLRFLPGKVGDISVYWLGEKGVIDSVNYFSAMFFKQLHEFGLTANFFSDAGIAVQLDYHATSFVDEGADHFMSVDVSHRYFCLGGVLGFGYHGASVRPYGGFSLPFLRFFSLEGNAEFFRTFPVQVRPAAYDPARVDSIWSLAVSDTLRSLLLAQLEAETRSIKMTPRNAVLFAGGLKMAFTPIGLTIYPRVEYIMNRYYKQDVRFLLTTNLLIKKYWSTGGGR